MCVYTHTQTFHKKKFHLDSIDDDGGGGGEKKINDQLQIDEFVIRLNENVCIIHKQQQAIFSGSIFFLYLFFFLYINVKKILFHLKFRYMFHLIRQKKKN